MSQQRVQFDDVKRAWMQIAFSGGNPTLDAIHKRIGYGSRSTIHKLRLKLLDELQERGVEILPARLPEALVPIIEEFWGHAIAQAGEAFSAERKEYQRDLEEGRAVRSEQQARICLLYTSPSPRD